MRKYRVNPLQNIMTYFCPAWEFAVERHVLKFQRTPTRDLHVTFKVPYMYDFVMKLCRQQAEVTISWKGLCSSKRNSTQKNTKSSNLMSVRHATVQVSKLSL
jgi:hypothetical protein